MAVYTWSQTAGSNASADSTINWAEGQAPSSVNDSARAMMAALAKYRDDIAGAITTGGTSTAYTVSSNSTFDTLGHLNGQIIAFTPHTTNGATVTLNVDSLGAKPLRWGPSIELQSGVLVQGTPYVALYNSSDAAFYLQGNGAGAPGIPLGSSLDYWGATAPSSAFAFPYGQQISQTTYASLYTLFGSNKYGTDSGGLFFLPDCRGRVVAGKDDMGGSAASRLTTATLSGTGLGATSSATETKTLVTANLPAYTPAGSVTVNNSGTTGGTSSVVGGLAAGSTTFVINPVAINSSGTFGGTAQGGTSTAFPIVQPTIIANMIIRII